MTNAPALDGSKVRILDYEKFKELYQKRIKPIVNLRRVKVLKSEKEFFEERAGIKEYMMGLDRDEAENEAVEELMNERKEKQEEFAKKIPKGLMH